LAAIAQLWRVWSTFPQRFASVAEHLWQVPHHPAVALETHLDLGIERWLADFPELRPP
jgi:hypothetical protein